MIHVVATLLTNPGERAFVLDAFNEMRPHVLEENGCIEYQPVADVEGADPKFGADTFLVLEKWESTDALDAHNKGPVLGAFLGKVKSRLASVTVHVLSPV